MAQDRDYQGVRVQVQVLPALRRFTKQDGQERLELHEYLRSYLDDLMKDLNIPATLSVKIDSGEESQVISQYPYRVSINSTPCRLPFRSDVQGDVSSRELACSISSIVHTNREMLVSPHLSATIKEKWVNDHGMAGLKGLSGDIFQRFLQELVHRGFGLEKGRNGIQELTESDATEQTPEKLFEIAISRLDNIAVKLYLSKAQYESTTQYESPEYKESFNGMLKMARDGLFYELGLLLPETIVTGDKNLKENQYRIQLNDVRLPAQEGLRVNEFLVNDTPLRLTLLKISGEKAINPANRSECARVLEREGVKEICNQGGLTTWDWFGYVILALSGEVRKHAGLFINRPIVKYFLNRLREAFPDLVDAAESRVELSELTQILRDLLDEELSIRDLRTILEALLTMDGHLELEESKGITFSPQTMDGLRPYMDRYISNKYARGGNTLVVVLLDQKSEGVLLQQGSLEPADDAPLMQALYNELGDLPPTVQTPLLLTKMEVRRKLKQLIQKELPGVRVLCYQDISADINIQPMGRITLN
jgi:type III secretory pathway component EscV